MRRFLISAVICCALIVPVLAGALPPRLAAASFAVDADSYCVDAEEFALLELVNSYRQENGLQPLALSATLGAAAEHHSTSMATYNYFDGSHDLHFEGPNQDESTTWQQNIENHGYPDNTTTSRAEILAAGFESASETLAQWRNSPSHNQHVLSPKYQAIGIGRAYNADAEYGWYWTMTFGSLLDRPAEPCSNVATGSAPAPGTELTISRSGRNGSSTESAVAYDGDESTAWYTTKARTPVTGYVWFDLGEPRTISRIEFLFAQTGGADAVQIQVSDDREAWETVGELNSPSAGEWQSLEWAGSARYVRFWFTNPNGVPVLGYLAEVRVYA